MRRGERSSSWSRSAKGFACGRPPLASSRCLPIPFPGAAHGKSQNIADRTVGMRAVAFEAMVLLPPLGRSAVPRARAASCVGRFETPARHRQQAPAPPGGAMVKRHWIKRWPAHQLRPARRAHQMARIECVLRCRSVASISPYRWKDILALAAAQMSAPEDWLCKIARSARSQRAQIPSTSPGKFRRPSFTLTCL